VALGGRLGGYKRESGDRFQETNETSESGMRRPGDVVESGRTTEKGNRKKKKKRRRGVQ